MRLTIPDDWDGESFDCYRIYWPNSQMWKIILAGFLSHYTRGRTWQESTGSVIDAQAQGWLFYDRNNPLEPCSSDTCCDEEYWFYVGLGASGMFITDIKCEAGWLWIKCGACSDWIAKCPISSITGDYVPDDFPEPDPPPWDNNCYKAGSLAAQFTEWLQCIGTYVYGNPGLTITQLTDYVKTTYPQNQWDFYSTYNMLYVAKTYPATVYAALMDSQFQTRLQCALYFAMANHSTVTAQDSWQLLYDDRVAIAANLGSYLPYDSHAISFIVQFFNAISLGYEQTVVAGYRDETFDCSGCVESELTPQSAVTASGWFMTQGYVGAGPQSASGEAYNNVCLADEPAYPFNCWGVAYRLVSTSQELWPGGAGGTTCTGTGPAGSGSWSVPQYIVRCHADIWGELGLVAEHAYNRSDDSTFNSNVDYLPDTEDGDDFLLCLRGDYETDVIGVEATDIRFICNVNNLT